MGRQLARFIIRLIGNSIGLWLVVKFLANDSVSLGSEIGVLAFLTAGLVFSLINSLIKPILVILSLPAIMLSLGLFLLVINGFLVYATLELVLGIPISFFDSILAGILLSLINYIVSISYTKSE